MHVFDKNGMFQFGFNAQTDDANRKIQIADLVTEKCAHISRLCLLLFFNIGDAVKTVPFTTKPDFLLN